MRNIDTHQIVRKAIKYCLILILIFSIFGILFLLGYYLRPVIQNLISKRETIGITSMDDKEKGLNELVIY